MKKKLLSLLLLPLILTSCNGGSASLASVKEKVSSFSDELLYPTYKVVGSADFNNIITEVDREFVNEPSTTTFVPYARYNDGFYNATADTSESDINNIIIYSLASKSYWLRAPLRINKSNFYAEVYTIKSSKLNGISLSINSDSGEIGSITLKNDKGEEVDYANAKISDVTTSNLTLSCELVSSDEDGKQVITPQAFTFSREGEADSTYLLAGKFVDNNKNALEIEKGSRENTTCAHYLLQHIITSYIGQTGSTNPSKNQMKMSITSEGHIIFYGEQVHTTVYIDNLPYYPDPSEHPEVGEWSEEYPIPCYQNKLNAKVNVRFEYNEKGWLIKEELSTVGYDYNVSSTSQAALVAVYGYKFA